MTDIKIWTFRFLFILFLISLTAKEPRNYSTFMLKSDNVILVGHNLDESPELHIPGLVCVNKRGVYREGITWYELIADPPDYEKAIVPFEEKLDPKLSWTSKYGSITFNNEGVDFPDGGINEKGLAIFEMSLGNAKYKHDDSNPTLFMVLWIQYVLDNYSSLDEVIQSAYDINLQGWSWHYFVTDKDGNCAIIEFFDGKVVVHSNSDVMYPVLCNTQYSKELDRIEDYRDFNGLWYKIRSFVKKPPRFVRAVKLMEEFNLSEHSSPKDYALQILNEIQIEEWNKWSILIDVRNMIIYFQTNKNRKLRYLSLSDFDFTADQNNKFLDIHTDLTRDVSAGFIDYAYDENLRHTRDRAKYLFIKRFKGLIDNGVSAEVYARRFADYSERIRREQSENQKK